jgi:hypothetical protein
MFMRKYKSGHLYNNVEHSFPYIQQRPKVIYFVDLWLSDVKGSGIGLI